MLHLEPKPLLYIFATDLDLTVLADGTVWIGDGTFEMAPTWTRLLLYPGPTLLIHRLAVHPLIVRFVQYFQNYWMQDVKAWNHHHNDGPRNTNIAEVLHSKLNRSFGHPHSAPHTFLKWFQKEHYSQQQRIWQLQHGLPVAL